VSPGTGRNMSRFRRDKQKHERRGASGRPLHLPARSRVPRVVYFAAEGARTEYDYMRFLRKVYGSRPGREFRMEACHPGHLNGLRPTEVVDLVVRTAPPGEEKWALFDRDAGDSRDRNIRDAMRAAARHGVQVAFSHPSFELWLMLHFQHCTGAEGGLNKVLIDRLRRHKDAAAFKDYDAGSGKGLTEQQQEALREREPTAVRNARKPVDGCEYGSCSAAGADTGPVKAADEPTGVWTRRTGHAAECDPLLRDPSSDVWRLLVSLGITEV
jgi:hypothetical protein